MDTSNYKKQVKFEDLRFKTKEELELTTSPLIIEMGDNIKLVIDKLLGRNLQEIIDEEKITGISSGFSFNTCQNKRFDNISMVYGNSPYNSRHNLSYEFFVHKSEEVVFKRYVDHLKRNEQFKKIEISTLAKEEITNINAYNYHYGIVFNPHGNCQVMSIRYFNSLIAYINMVFGKKDLAQILMYELRRSGLQRHFSKYIIQFDLNEAYYNLIDGKMPFVFPAQKYKSTNESVMVTGMFYFNVPTFYFN